MDRNLEIKKYIQKGIIPFSVNISQYLNKAGEYKKNVKWCGAWKDSTLENPKIINKFNSVGLITGKKSGIFVLDIDDLDEWKQLLEDYEKDEPNTPKAISGSGGFHYYFKYTEKMEVIPSVAPIIGKKIDSRNNGGCIFAPPSTYFSKKENKNVSYQWAKGKSIFEMEMAEVPNWLYKIMSEKKKTLDEIEKVKNEGRKNMKPSDLLNFELKKDTIELKQNCIQELVENLKDERAGPYSSWSEIGFALRSYTKYNLFSIFNEFSKRTPVKDQYDNGSVIKFWNGYKPDGNKNCISINSIMYWSKLDNPENYYKILRKYRVIKDDYYDEDDEDIEDESNFVIDQEYLLPNKRIQDEGCKVSEVLNKFTGEEKNKCLMIKSPYNTGKTTLLKELCKQYENIIFISYRITLSNNLFGGFEDLGFVKYTDNVDANKVIIQLDSIPNIEDLNKFDLVIMDESEGLLNHFKSPTLLPKNPLKVFEMLIQICNKAKKIIALDGDLEDRTKTFIKSLGETLYIKNKIKKDIKQYHIHQNENIFKDLLLTDLKDEKNVCLVSMEQKRTLQYYNELKDIYKSIMFDSFTDDKQKALLANADKIMAQYQFVSYTPCIEAGVDINIEHFDKIYIILSGGSTSQRGLNQMIARIRQLKDNNIHVFLNDIPLYKKSYKHYNIYELKNYYAELNAKSKQENSDVQYENGECVRNKYKFSLYDTINMIYNEQELRNKDKNIFLPLWLQMNRKKGHPEAIFYDEDSKKIKDEDNIKLNLIVSAPNINKNEYQTLKSKQARQNMTKMEKLSMTKYIYEKTFEVEMNDIDTLKKYINRLSVINNLDVLLDRKELNKDNSSLINTVNETKFKINKSIMKLFNIDAHKLLTTSLEFTKEQIDENKDKLNELIKNDRILFGLKKAEKIESFTKLIAFLKNVCEHFGIETEHKRSGDGGKNVKYIFNIDENILKVSNNKELRKELSILNLLD